MIKIGIPLKYHHLDDGRNILYLGEKLRRTVQSAGGFVIPIVQVQDVDYYDTRFNEFDELTKEEKKSIDKYLDMVDGVIIPGGFKVTPYDVYLLRRCIEKNIPTLGICLGMQLMSCYGEDFKVFPIESNINHYQDSDDGYAHKVIINKDSLLYKIIGKEEISVNSFHRYHVTVNNKYIVNATSKDGFIEGIELPDQKFHIGIQWHPDISYNFDSNARKLLNYFIDVCSKS